MQRVAFLLLLLSLPASGGQIRLFGTNTLVDFTAANLSGPNSDYSQYWIHGTILRRVGQCAVVERETGSIRYFYQPSDYDLASNDSILKALAAQRMTSSNGISYAQYLSMSPQMQIRFMPRKEVETVYVLNVDVRLKVGQPVFACALKAKPMRLPEGTLPAFDLGVEYTGAPGTNHQVLTATPKGLVKVKR